MKLKVQAQHLQPGDIVGSGEIVNCITVNSTGWASNKVMVSLYKIKEPSGSAVGRNILWGKYTMINVERQTSQEKLESDYLMREGD